MFSPLRDSCKILIETTLVYTDSPTLGSGSKIPSGLTDEGGEGELIFAPGSASGNRNRPKLTNESPQLPIPRPLLSVLRKDTNTPKTLHPHPATKDTRISRASDDAEILRRDAPQNDGLGTEPGWEDHRVLTTPGRARGGHRSLQLANQRSRCRDGQNGRHSEHVVRLLVPGTD